MFCLRACAAILAAVLSLHVLVLVGCVLANRCRRKYTWPHRLGLGVWEVRCLPHLAYPASCAAVLVLLGEEGAAVSERWRAGAAVAVAVPVVVALAAAVSVKSALEQGFTYAYLTLFI